MTRAHDAVSGPLVDVHGMGGGGQILRVFRRESNLAARRFRGQVIGMGSLVTTRRTRRRMPAPHAGVALDKGVHNRVRALAC